MAADGAFVAELAPVLAAGLAGRAPGSQQDAGLAAGILLLLMSSLAVMGAVLLAPVIPLMVQHFANVPGAAVLVPMALVVPGLCVALASPAAGALVDAVGRKPVLLSAFVVYAIAGLLPFWLDSLYLIILSRIFVGLAEAAVMTASTTLIADYYDGARRQKWLAWQTGVASLSAIVLIAAGGVLGAHGWRTPFFVYGLAIMFLPASLLLLPRAPVSAVHNAERHSWSSIRPILWICAISVVAGLGFYAVPIQLASLLAGRGASSTLVIGLAAAAASAAVPAGSFLFGRIGHWPLTRLLACSFVIMAAGFGAIGLFQGFWPTLAGAVVASLGAGIVLPALLTGAATRVAQESRGHGVGAWTASLFLGQFCSPLLVALLNTVGFSLGGSFCVLGAMFGLLGAAFWAWPASGAQSGRQA